MLATIISPISIKIIDDHFVRLLINLISGIANIQAQIPVLKIPYENIVRISPKINQIYGNLSSTLFILYSSKSIIY